MSNNIFHDTQELEQFLRHTFQTPLKISIATEAINVEALSLGERTRLEQFTAPHRREVWLRGRAALKNLLERFGESRDTATVSFPNPQYSLTHRGRFHRG